MPSYLTFAATEQYRSVLMARNLAPYTVPGAYSPNVTDITYETVLRDEGVYDSPDNLIADDPFADLLYPLNAYGPLNGYDKNINAGGLANTKSNLGPYEVSDTKLPQLSLPYEATIPVLNKYSFESINLESSEYIQLEPKFTFYANPDPIAFVPSQYTPYQVLINDNPFGSDGSLSQDSTLAQLGAKSLREDFRSRIAREIEQNTLGSINLPNVYNDPVMAVQILQGKIPLIERDWVITRPDNLLVKSADLATRLSGAYFPDSLIPGDYFTLDNHSQNLYKQIANSFQGENKSAIAKLLFRQNVNPSQLFLNNTGGGQKSQMYFTLGFNKYGPEYDRSFFGELLNKGKNALASLFDIPIKGGFYIGDKQNDPSKVEGPSGKLPLNSQGGEIESIVYGPDALAKLYEPTIDNVKFGLIGDSFFDNGGISGGLIWSTVDSDLKFGFKVGRKGKQIIKDEEYNQTSSYINLTSSNEQTFRDGSILYQTQKLVEAGNNDVFHVGNAINQVSKVFNDGYREITKGSRVMTYVNENGVEVGKEYCRIFTKDTPYLTYADLQKTDGNIRRFAYSVLDKTYNLNIAPIKSTNTSTSTNIKDGKAQKYMFSLENLAWRTSYKPGYRVSDLPECERGPNGGRVMWFPPYNLTFSENTSISFNGTSFIGRPEPIYTYANTTRSGSLNWTIIVDHPAILNTIVNKELNGKRGDEVNSIVDSFFAGCKKYDIYELARKYNMLSISELYEYQQILTSPNSNEEAINQVSQEINSQQTAITNYNNELTNFINLGYYFENDIPLIDNEILQTTSQSNFKDLYDVYVSEDNIFRYNNQANISKDPDKTKERQTAQTQIFNGIINNFNKNQELINKLKDLFKSNTDTNGNCNLYVEITFKASASAPANEDYNQSLSYRRYDSVVNYFKSLDGLSKYIESKNLTFTLSNSYGENTVVKFYQPGSVPDFGPYDCRTSLGKSNYDQIYSPQVMACRRVAVASIVAKVTPKPKVTNPTGSVPEVTINQSIRDGISKKILRRLLTECDYFNLIEEKDPMYKNTIKDKIKYFDPAFHSITPEGLNSRLTFLQQCSRPGETIPIIGLDGKPKYNSASNTAFGAPPVLVLRIGDFYNTKIIPTSINISYEQLDINPEGIGVQPMLAKITLGFNFIGGSGLKEPIDRLQNALSFNYYANTEMYDERADVTDTSYKKIDDELVNSIINQVPIVTENDVDNYLTNDGGTTIGVIVTSQESSAGVTGTINYSNIMDDLLTNGQQYISSITNNSSQIITEYNYPIYTAYIQSRNYLDGYSQYLTIPKELKIFGKPSNIDLFINRLYDKIYDDIDKSDRNNPLYPGLYYIRYLYNERYDNNIIRRVKQNLKNIVSRTKNNILTSLNFTNNEITNVETNLVKLMSKIDFVATKSDGFIDQNQATIIYNISGDSYSELITDYDKSVDDLYTFYYDLVENGLLDVVYDVNDLVIVGKLYVYLDGIDTYATSIDIYFEAEKRFYSVMSKILLNDNSYASFINELIPNDLGNTTDITLDYNVTELRSATEKYFNNIRECYKKEKADEVEFINKFKNSDNYKNLYGNNWRPYVPNKSRIFTFNNYISGTDEQKTNLNNLYKNGNWITDIKTFNGKNKLN